MLSEKHIELVRAVGRYSHMGFMLGIFGIGGFFLGRWIDSKLWKYPVFAVVFFFIGFGLVFYRFILMLQEDAGRKDKTRKDRDE
ncbi:MAG: AtpZ/AtpI family protein [Planctomycetes bacterium]|nr:AtpZ/AtpI family protein [Planctomycetota bacterium]